MKKAGFVAIIGRPNSGKSTLMNTVCGRKIAIVSHIPQTTRNTIKGIYTKDDRQLIFLDTPGVHDSIRTYNKMLTSQAVQAVEEADAILYIMDISRPFGAEEEGVIDMLKKTEKPVVVAFNKADIISNHTVENSLRYKEAVAELPHHSEHYISGLKGNHIEELLTDLMELMPEQEFYYPEGIHTDAALDFQVGEIIREKAMLRTYEEIPHAISVDVADIDEDNEKRLISIMAEIHVERDSQKGVIIGKGGQQLKKIGMDARKELEEMFKRKVYLQLQVKVDKNWRNR
ncbi:MAG: GTPase Era [Candidatus Gracilibacteria bacterium]